MFVLIVYVDETTRDLKVNEKSSQESIDDAKERIKSLRVDKDNDDGKTWHLYNIMVWDIMIK